jgi:hypothetical protein
MPSPLIGMRRETDCADGDAGERPVFPARSAGSPWTVLGTGDVAVQPRPGSEPVVLPGRWQSLPLTGRRAAWPRAGGQGASRWLLPGRQRGLSAAAPGARRPHKVIVAWRRARRLGRLCRRYQPSPGDAGQMPRCPSLAPSCIRRWCAQRVPVDARDRVRAGMRYLARHLTIARLPPPGPPGGGMIPAQPSPAPSPPWPGSDGAAPGIPGAVGMA